jgi:DNA-binding transcriptional LysR family regulator
VSWNAEAIGFDLRMLQVFLIVCETGSMTGAALRLRLTQPAVSQIVRNLEKRLGNSLFDRGLRPFGLTSAGAALQQQAIQLLDQARKIPAAIHGKGDSQLAMIRVGLVDSVSSIFTPLLATQLQPLTAQLSFWSGLALAHGTALVERQLDLIVTSEPLEDYDGFDRFDLVTEPFILVLPAELANLANKNLREIAPALPLLRYSDRSHIGQVVERHLRRIGVEVPRRIECDTTEQVTAMIESGSGWTLTTPLCMLQARPNMARIHVATVPGPGFRRSLTLIARSGELGRVPSITAGLARRILSETCLPQIYDLMPAIRNHMRVG